MALQVTLTDTVTGEVRTETVADDDYLIIPGEKVDVSTQLWPKTGTHQVTLRGCRRTCLAPTPTGPCLAPLAHDGEHDGGPTF